MSAQREAVCHPACLDDLRHWIATDQRTARRLLELMRVVLLRADRVEFLQGRYHY